MTQKEFNKNVEIARLKTKNAPKNPYGKSLHDPNNPYNWEKLNSNNRPNEYNMDGYDM